MSGPRSANDINNRLGYAIRDRRVTLGKSQVDVAKAIGTTHQMVQRYERGIANFTIVRLSQLASALGLSIFELITTAFGKQAISRPVCDRATLEIAKRFSKLKPHEKQAVKQLVQKLGEAA